MCAYQSILYLSTRDVEITFSEQSCYIEAILTYKAIIAIFVSIMQAAMAILSVFVLWHCMEQIL